MKIVEKPWGHEEWLEVNDNYAMKKLVVNPGQKLSLQYHENKLETMYCIKGVGQLQMDGKYIPMMAGVFHTIKPGEIHRLVAGLQKLVIIECSTPQLDDVVRLEDDYYRTRNKQGEENVRIQDTRDQQDS